MKKLIVFIGLSLSLVIPAQAGLLYNYSQLALRDLDQMVKIINDKVKESKKAHHGKVVPLKEALQAVYARPNSDGMIEKVIAPLRTALDEQDAWDRTLTELTDEAINALKNPKAFSPVVQVTYSVFLENLLSEFKPYAAKEGFERTLVQKIRDAKIELTAAAQNERSLKLMMKDSASPSVLASQILGEEKSE